jgi:hypothetical protein
MTKRKWRRLRGKIIAKFPNCKALRRVPYSETVMTQIVNAFLYGE